MLCLFVYTICLFTCLSVSLSVCSNVHLFVSCLVFVFIKFCDCVQMLTLNMLNLKISCVDPDELASKNSADHVPHYLPLCNYILMTVILHANWI